VSLSILSLLVHRILFVVAYLLLVEDGVVDVSVAAGANEGLAKRQVRGNESDTSQLIRTKWDLLPEKLFGLG
jgi:hypothetical protein